ncbi:MAG: hypothetical protein HMLKMBBP_01705 [Planctomycetes bacterium]|nr:hypothetical protein [Planctomycetota bacterium]
MLVPVKSTHGRGGGDALGYGVGAGAASGAASGGVSVFRRSPHDVAARSAARSVAHATAARGGIGDRGTRELSGPAAPAGSKPEEAAPPAGSAVPCRGMTRAEPSGTGDDRILDVDLVAFERGDRDRRRAVVDGVMRSLRTGFVYVAHDVPEDVIDDAYAKLAAFFRMPDDVKRRFVVPGSMGQSGYTGLAVETAASRDTPDWKEMLNWGRELPPGHPLRRKYPHRYMERALPEPVVPGISASLSLLWDRFLGVQTRFLRVVATGLGAEPTFFDGMLADGPTLARAIRYPPMRGAPGTDYVWAGEHEDINLITALPRATARGLQVKVEGRGWVDAVAPAGHCIVNTGMMIARVTNGAVRAGPHRVVAHAGDDAVERFSVVQFCHPSPWTILAPMPQCVTPERPLRDAPVEAGDWLDQVLWDINLCEDARRVPADGSAPKKGM